MIPQEVDLRQIKEVLDAKEKYDIEIWDEAGVLEVGMEGVPYTKPWGYMIKRRILASIMYLGVAVIVAAIVVLIGKF